MNGLFVSFLTVLHFWTISLNVNVLLKDFLVLEQQVAVPRLRKEPCLQLV